MQSAAFGVALGTGDDMLGFGGCQWTRDSGRDADDEHALRDVLVFGYQRGRADDGVRVDMRV